MRRDLSSYLVTDPHACGALGVTETVRQAVSSRVRVVQLRDKSATDEAIAAQLIELSRVIDGRALLLANDRLDAVIAARARGAKVDGVHLGQDDRSVTQARELLGPDAVIGLSANTREQFAAVRALPASTVDYLGVGVIAATDTKPDHPPVLGIEGFAALAAESALPCVAIGGIGLDDVGALRRAGAAGVAVVSAICGTDNPATAAADLLQRWRRAGVPRVLTIAGSDPSGGAGIQADVKSIGANGGYAMAAVTSLTVQNTQGVRSVHIPPAEFLRQQLDAISDDITIDAVKIGMLASDEVIDCVSDWPAAVQPPVVVIDPVMVATSGDRLLDPAAEASLRDLLVRADVITPNLPELAVLADAPTDQWDAALKAAEALSRSTGAAVLAKGGHRRGEDATDALIDTANAISMEFAGSRINTTNTHGTGCSLASAIATRLAAGDDTPTAVGAARTWLRESIRAGHALQVGQGNGPIDHFAGLFSREG